MLKAKRFARYNHLLQYGFMRFEAYAISAMPIEPTRFMRQMIIDRKKLLRQAIREKWTKEKYKLAVHLEYERQDWIIKDTPMLQARGKRLKSVGRDDVWQMVRYYRDLYKDKDPKWKSPEKPRKKKLDEHGRRIDKGKVAEQRKRWKARQRQLKDIQYYQKETRE